jgi:hypothetical protein
MDAFKIYYLDTSQTGSPKHFVNIKAKNIVDAAIKFERWSAKAWRYGFNPYRVEKVRNVTPPKIKTITESLWAFLEN